MGDFLSRFTGWGLGGFNGLRSAGGGGGGGVFGSKAIALDGVDGYLDAGDQSDMNGDQAFSWSVWVLVDSTQSSGAEHPIVIKRVAGGAGYYFAIQQYGAGSYDWRLSSLVDDGTATPITAATTQLPPNKWIHVLFVFDGVNTVEIYTDGVLHGTATASITVANITNSETLKVGTDADLQKWTGVTFRDLAFWPSDQSANVAAIYNSGTLHDLTDLGSPPTHYWPVASTDNLTATTGSVADVIGAADFTPTGTASGDLIDYEVPTVTPTYQGARSFDGQATGPDVVNPAIGTPLSMSLWVGHQTSASGRVLLSKWTSGNTGGWMLRRGSNVTRLELWIKSNAANRSLVCYGTTLASSGWQHLAATWSGVYNELPKLYINGSAVTTTQQTNTLTSDDTLTTVEPVRLNKSGVTGFGFENDAFMRDVAIWDGTELSAANVTSLYNAGAIQDLTSFTPAPSHYWECAATGDDARQTVGVLNGLVGSADLTPDSSGSTFVGSTP